MKYRTIYADPPWPERGAGKIKRGADRHYPLMTVRAIADLARAKVADGLFGVESPPLARVIADDAHLYLWVTNNFLPAGLEVMAAWGFRYVTKVDWFKGREDDDGEVILEASGLGQYFRGDTESCLFGVRGACEYRTLPNGKRAQGRTAIVWPRGEHSRKPAEMRAMIERVSWGPYLELFAREAAPGWDRWGSEAPGGAGRVDLG